MLTAETITDAQIRELRDSGEIGPSTEYFALSAGDEHTKLYYRARCAEIFNTRDAKEAP